LVVISWVVSGSVCVGVPLQCGYGGVASLCSLKHYSKKYFYSINVLCKLLSQKKILVFPSAPLVLKSIIGRFLAYSEVRFDEVPYFKPASPISSSIAELPRNWLPAVRRRNNGRHSQ